ncbi:MAG: hypothetical protein E7377_04135 [Clostridiales bacterium]|nr:hypothetical protein [Clostridiales bacterium]
MATFTVEQQNAINAQGRVIVSASAGSGKTTVMIEKIIRLIKNGHGVDEILAVTFTKKAAASMKEKLCKELIEEINSPSVSQEYKTFLKKQLSEVPSADISTIHSFCSKLIRSHFFAADVDNGFRVIGGDDAEGTALKNEALDELLEEGYEAQTESFSHLLSVYWRKKSDRALRDILSSAYEKLRNRADYKEYLKKCADYDENTFEDICVALKNELDEKCRYYYELVEDERAYFMDACQDSAQYALCDELMMLLEETISSPSYFTACQIAKPKFSVNRKSKKDSAEKVLHIDRLAFLKGRIVKIYDDELAKVLPKEEEKLNFLLSGKTAAALAECLLIFDEKYARLKKERGVLDYNDLEHKALELLAQETVVEEVRGKYRYVFVDEYQDVNPVQEEIVSRVGGENLFLVGDVKQAIYGFRGSKSRFFVEKQKDFEKGDGQNLFMTRNFRSSDKVLDAVNSQFSLAMTPRVCDVDYARGSVMEKGGRYALNSGKVCVYFLGKEEKTAVEHRGVYSVKEHTVKEKQKESLLAKTIRSIIENERNQKFYDPDKGAFREIKYSDIAVLSRKKQGQIAKTVEALSEAGLPVTAASAVNICDFSEIKTLIDLLSLIDNAEQDIPLCSVLLSAVGNLTADDLVEIRLAYPQTEVGAFRKACRKYAAEKQDILAYKLNKFYQYYEEIRLLSRVLDAGELLTRIIEETRMEAVLLSRLNGMAALKRIHRFIEEASSPEPLCVHAFLDRLRDLGYTIEYSENGGEDSVKVMTMHSSKGLEYPIVILDNLSAPFRGVDKDEVCIEEEYGLAPYAFKEETMTKSTTLLRRLYEVRESKSSISDSLNLYYVALTRAKYGLHMLFESRTPVPDVKYAHSFAEFTDFSVWQEYITELEIFDLEKQDRQPLVFRPDKQLTQDIMQAFTWKYPFAGYENLPVKSSATKLMESGQRGDAEDRNAALFDANGQYGEKGETSKETGVAYHAFLENFDFSLLYENGGFVGKDRLSEIVQEALKIADEQGMYQTKLLSAEKLVEILSNSVFKELQGKRLYKEQRFLTLLPVKETYAKRADAPQIWRENEHDEEVIFQGAIDLLAVGEDFVHIIDYKFSAGGAEYLREHYCAQLQLYRLATSKIMGIPAERIKCTIVNIYRGFQVDVE